MLKVKMSSPYDLSTACDLDADDLAAKLMSGNYESTWIDGGKQLLVWPKKTELANLPDPYQPEWQQVQSAAACEIRNRAADRTEIKKRRTRALEDFERRLAERDRLDRITLIVCAVVMIGGGLLVWWLNT